MSHSLALGAAFYIFYLCVTQKDVMFQQWPAVCEVTGFAQSC